MDAKLKEEWVKALRSETYQQGIGALIKGGVDQDFFCCLGVLCDVAGTDWVDKRMEHGILGEIEVRSEGSSYLSAAMLSRIGLTDTSQRTLAAMNDDGETFKQIADYIEQNL